MLRLLFVAPNYAPAWHLGGVVQMTRNLSRELVRRGHQVTVFTTDSGKYRRVEVPVNREVELEGVKVFYFRTDFLMKFAFSASLWQACRRLGRDFDLVQLSSIWHFPEIPGGAYALRHDIPLVVRTMGALLPQGLKKSRWKKWLYLTLVERRHFFRCRGIQYSTLMERDLAPRYYQRFPSFVIPSGIATEEFQELPERSDARKRFSLPPRALTAVFLGRLEPIKNLPNLLRGVAVARQQGLELFLLLGGPDFGIRKALEGLTAELGLADRVRFLGYVPPQDRKVLLAAADFLVLPSVQENFGIAAVEAMAAGLPVLVSRTVGISREVAMDGAGVVTGLGPEAIAAGLLELGRQPEELPRMGARARQAALSRFDIKAIAKKFERAYLDILEGTQSPELYWSNGRIPGSNRPGQGPP